MNMPKAIRRHGRAWTSLRARLFILRLGPEDLDYKGKHVLIIGSGATAATLAPAIAADCCHVTVLQRSPHLLYSWRQ